jgi:ATP-dependent Clp protease ATP-binding subunit ClpX
LQNGRIEKSNILLVGLSGSGKFHVVKSLASYPVVGLVIGDATSLTETGYGDDDVGILWYRRIQPAGGDLEAARREDCIHQRDRRAPGERVGWQGHAAGRAAPFAWDAWGHDFHDAAAEKPEAPGSTRHPFDTARILFICGGSLIDLEDIVGKRLGQGGFGFGQVTGANSVAASGLLREVKPQDCGQLEVFLSWSGGCPYSRLLVLWVLNVAPA